MHIAANKLAQAERDFDIYWWYLILNLTKD